MEHFLWRKVGWIMPDKYDYAENPSNSSLNQPGMDFFHFVKLLPEF